MATEEADRWERKPVGGYLLDELDAVEGFIRDLGARREYLSEEESYRLTDARRCRRALRDEIESLRRPHRERAYQWRATARKLAQALKRRGQSGEESEQLRLLLQAIVPLRPFLVSSDLGAMQDAIARVRLLEQQAARKTPPKEPAAESEQQDNDFSALDAYLSPPGELEFSPDDGQIVARLASGSFDSAEDYHLNVAAQELSLLSGFELLLCLPLLRGIEQYPFQINTAKQVLRSMRGRALLCDEVGLGKTIEAGLIMKEYLVRGLVRKVLVLTPPSLTGQWKEEMRDKFGIDFLTHNDQAFRALGPTAWQRCDRIIASLATAKSKAHRSVLRTLEFDLIIVDEAHHLKNRATLNWSFVNELKSKYLLLLTATPVQNNLDELFNLITLLSPGQLKTPQAFRREFIDRKDPRKPRNQTRLRELMIDVMVRNTRSQVNVALPARRAHTLLVDQSAEERRLYEAVTQFVRDEYRHHPAQRLIAQILQAEAGSSAAALRATLTSMRDRHPQPSAELQQLCDLASGVATSSKLDALLRLVRARSEKLLVFTRFSETHRMLVKALGEAGVSPAAFSSEMTAAEKDAQIAAFSRDQQVLVSTDVGSEGRNLQFCHSLVNYDLPWNPMRIEQRVGRIHRIGQVQPVTIVNLAARDTLEHYLLEVLDSKINMFELIIGEIGMILGNLEGDREFEDLVLDLWASADSGDAAQHAFSRLGEELVQAQRGYLESKAYDDRLFGEDLTAES